MVPTLRPQIEVRVVGVPEAFWNFRELPSLALNGVFHDEAMRAINGRRVSLVYQRYSLNNYVGLRLARQLGVPLVVEYNGSEIWMSRHWGHPLKYEQLSSKIEMLNVNGADLVVVVSRAMRDELVGRQVASDRILINPNGVDPDALLNDRRRCGSRELRVRRQGRDRIHLDLSALARSRRAGASVRHADAGSPSVS
jgi:glycosyltransferase involved in cell wall biosynthesis